MSQGDELDGPRCAARAPWHKPLHDLWTRAVGTPGYVKSDWIDLEVAIESAPASSQNCVTCGRAIDRERTITICRACYGRRATDVVVRESPPFLTP